MNYATETTQITSKQINQSFLNALEQGQIKEAEAKGTNFVRSVVRQSGNFREVIPPVAVTEAELTRDVRSEEPKKVVEKEPQSAATFVQFMGTPPAYWFRGRRYEVYFGKIMSPKAVKSKFTLMTHENDIRKILVDNFCKDMTDQEDISARRTSTIMVNKNASVQRGTFDAFSSSAFKRSFQAMLDRRIPLGRLLLTESLYMELVDLPATMVGSDLPKRWMESNIQGMKGLWGVPVTSSAKVNVYDPREAWLYSTPEFLGNFFFLQDATLFIKQEADMIEFYTYEVPGIGIGNRLSIQHILFPRRS